MKTRIILVIILVAVQSGVFAQDVLGKFPPLDKPWSGSDYFEALDVLKAERDAGRAIPSINDETFKAFYTRLLSFENLNSFLDDSKTFAERSVLIQPYFQAFPQYLDLYLEANMNDEAISITRLLLEATKRSTVLYELKFKDMNDTDVVAAKTGLQDPMFSIGNGSFKLLEENRGKVKSEYLISMATWLSDNFTTIYPYLSDRGKVLVRERVQTLAKSDPNKSIKKLMSKLDKKLK